MIYTITLTNKKTGQEVSRDYELDFKYFDGIRLGVFDYNVILNDMKKTLDNDEEKF